MSYLLYFQVLNLLTSTLDFFKAFAFSFLAVPECKRRLTSIEYFSGVFLPVTYTAFVYSRDLLTISLILALILNLLSYRLALA